MTDKPKPYRCPVCAELPESYYGRLVFPDEQGTPTCPNHKGPSGEVIVVELVPAGG